MTLMLEATVRPPTQCAVLPCGGGRCTPHESHSLPKTIIGGPPHTYHLPVHNQYFVLVNPTLTHPSLQIQWPSTKQRSIIPCSSALGCLIRTTSMAYLLDHTSTFPRTFSAPTPTARYVVPRFFTLHRFHPHTSPPLLMQSQESDPRTYTLFAIHKYRPTTPRTPCLWINVVMRHSSPSR